MKAKTESLLLGRVANLADILYLLVIVFLPTQLGRHFFISESYIFGIRIDYLSPTLYITDILIAILFIFSLPFLLRITPLFISSLSKLSRISVLLVLTSLLYSFFSSDRPILVWYSLFKTAEMTFFVIYTYYFLKNGKKIAMFLFALSCGMFFESILAIVQFFRQSSLDGLLYVFGERTFTSNTPGIANATLDGRLLLRPYGTLPHPNVLAGYLLAGIIFLWSLRGYIHGVALKAWLTTVLLLSVVGLFLSLSRITIGLFVAIVVLQLWQMRSHSIPLSRAIYPAVFFLGLVFMSFDFLAPRFFELFQNSEAVDKRLELIFISIEMTRDHKFFGVGPMHFLVSLPSYQDEAKSVLFIQPVHNIFLLTLSEIGIVGVVGVCLFLYDRIRKAMWRQMIKDKLLVLSVFVIVGIGTVDHYFLTLQQGQLLLGLMTGLIFVCIKRLSYQDK